MHCDNGQQIYSALHMGFLFKRPLFRLCKYGNPIQITSKSFNGSKISKYL